MGSSLPSPKTPPPAFPCASGALSCQRSGVFNPLLTGKRIMRISFACVTPLGALRGIGRVISEKCCEGALHRVAELSNCLGRYKLKRKRRGWWHPTLRSSVDWFGLLPDGLDEGWRSPTITRGSFGSSVVGWCGISRCAPSIFPIPEVFGLMGVGNFPETSYRWCR